MDTTLFIPNPPLPETQNLKFTVGTSDYERHFPILSDPDVSFDTLMFHIEMFKTTIISAVTANQQGRACFLVFPRTLIHPSYAHSWAALVAEANNHTTLNAFDATLLLFIKEFYTPAHRVLLAQELRKSRLPRNMRVTAFAQSLKRNNNRIVSLPGTEPPLTQDQVKMAFFEAMPVTWKANWNNPSVGNVQEMEFASIVEYFADQQIMAIDKVKRNNEKQRAVRKISPSNKSDKSTTKKTTSYKKTRFY
jgi:hypothetical protein